MLSDEEKEAIDNMKSLLLYSKEHEYFSPFQEQEIDDMNIVLNIVEKQSKEIEETKKQLDLDNECEIALNNRIMDLENADKKWEDKIKAKIEVLEIEQESNREDLKIAIDNLLFQNIDKIGNRISINMSVREILQSLLEKE